MSYTLGTAAKATGRSKATILRAIRSGKVSAEKDANGAWKIDPSELHRVYPEVSLETVSSVDDDAIGNPLQHNMLHYELALRDEQLASAHKEIAHLEAQIEDLKDQRTQLRADIEAWRSAAMQKRLTWRGLFGSGKAE